MITEHQLLRMPNKASLAIFGDSYKAQYFDWRYGDMLLALQYAFSDSEIEAALAAGGEIVTGYSFSYYVSVPVQVSNWCACSKRGFGFALSRETAEFVAETSYAEFKADIERCYAEQERKRLLYEERERNRRGRWVY